MKSDGNSKPGYLLERVNCISVYKWIVSFRSHKIAMKFVLFSPVDKWSLKDEGDLPKWHT